MVIEWRVEIKDDLIMVFETITLKINKIKKGIKNWYYFHTLIVFKEICSVKICTSKKKLFSKKLFFMIMFFVLK